LGGGGFGPPPTATSTGEASEDAEHAEEYGTDRARWRVKRRYPTEALIFDTETETGPAQRLRLLVWRLYSDAPGGPPGRFCVEEGVAYPDELPDNDRDGYRVLITDADRREANVAPGFGAGDTDGGLMVRPLSWWLKERLYIYGYTHRARCAVVAFNLPFDLGRLASYWGAAEGDYRGGWSLGIWGSFGRDGGWHDMRYRQRLLMKAIDPRRTLFSWGSRKKGDEDQKGAAARFIDLRTLAFALTDKSYTLEGACKAFGDPYEKAEVEFDEFTPELIGYALEDVRHTSALYRNALAELVKHQSVDLQPHRLYSPATVGARYLEAMGVARPLEKFTNLTDQQLGWDTRAQNRPTAANPEGAGVGQNVLGAAMSAFYGGRAEARIVRTPVPVVHVDFTSMYPAVNELLGTWKILRAERIRTIDATDQVRELLSDEGLIDRCLTRELWREIGVTLVEIEPDGDILPVRANYQPDSDDLGIGLNPLTYNGRLWYALPDVLAAAVLGHRSPRVTRAIRMEGKGVQPGLRPVRLRGGTLLDPLGRRDPFLVMIEERARVKANKSLPKSERDRLELFLKITANATAYGSLARFDRRDLAEKVPVAVHGPDVEPRQERISTPEDPGPYCFPPVACSITAGARLMLAILERLITDAGGSYAFCDTDSMAIIATADGGPVPCNTSEGESITALPWHTVRSILDRFDPLNPYDPALLQPWKVEHDSLDRQLYCYAISAKRYALYRQDLNGKRELVAACDHDDAPDDEPTGDEDSLTDWSEHGLGMYLDPTIKLPGKPQRDEKGRRRWIRDTWDWVLSGLDAQASPMPAWAQQYALTQFTVSSPALAKWFKGYNAHQPSEQHIRPGSFGLIAHPDPAFYTPAAEPGARRKPPGLPAAPYERNPERWTELPWYDRATGDPLNIITAQARDEPERFAHALTSGAVIIDTLANILARYTRRPEHKSLAPDDRAADGTTSGLLLRRPVHSGPATTLLTGKEGNKIIERLTGQVTGPGEYRNDYGTRSDPWKDLILPVLKDMGAARIIAHGIPTATAYRTLSEPRRPRRANRERLQAAAVAFASERLAEWQLAVPSPAPAVLAAYLDERERRGESTRRCAWCGEPMPTGARADSRYHNDACRQAARRARLRT
jgi:hypothetical protein